MSKTIQFTVAAMALSVFSGCALGDVTLPGGGFCFIKHHHEIVCAKNDSSAYVTILNGQPSKHLSQNLSHIGGLFASPDGGMLYFQAQAWATSNAIHSVAIRSGAVKFITAGQLDCVVLIGQYQGDLVITQHRYFIQGGSYNPTYLFTPSGKNIGIVARSYAQTPTKSACVTLGAS